MHTEETLEALIEAYLVDAGGYQKGTPAEYDRTRALLPQTLLAFIEDTQPKVWQALRAIHKDKLETLFFDALSKTLEQQGKLDVLRHGCKFYGKTVQLAVFAPSNQHNPGLWELFQKNRLTVIRQGSGSLRSPSPRPARSAEFSSGRGSLDGQPSGSRRPPSAGGRG